MHIGAYVTFAAFNVAAGESAYECFCRDSGKHSSRKECFLEEDEKPTKAFFYEILRDDDGFNSARTKYCDLEPAGEDGIKPLQGCTLDHFKDKGTVYTYREYIKGERTLNQDHRHTFTKLKKVPKKELKKEYKRELLKFVSRDPGGRLFVTSKGEIQWQKDGNHIEEGLWSKKARNVPKSERKSHFTFPSGTVGYFSEGIAIILKPTLIVLVKEDLPLAAAVPDARHPDSPHSSEDEEPPSYDEYARSSRPRQHRQGR
ncbi:hypothetical protein FOL47_003866 [Perkinsus chesapeaki]|uniref:Uncharacterized protein n=1 Tax=Perkinsus chesapeaki TaxID=330153 RepID=A0A7J6M5P7_PERCH|nr:hypothetical protein FOL47_003866 [Perkinsus chesapeaki]